MRYIAIDVGNTRTKLALFNRSDVQKYADIPTQKNISSERLLTSYTDHLGLAQNNTLPMFMSCVVAEVLKKISSKVTSINHQSPLDFTIARSAPETLGADLIAATQGLAASQNTPVIVIDSGTATTITYLDKDNVFRGGIIAPGLHTSALALFNQTSLLKPIDLEGPLDIFASTSQISMRTGLIEGHASMIQGLVQKIIRAENLSHVFIAATGGAIPLLSQCLPDHYVIRPHLVLEGIASIAIKHMAKKL